MIQADGRTPVGKGKGRGKGGRKSGVRDEGQGEGVGDEDGEMSMELDHSKLATLMYGIILTSVFDRYSFPTRLLRKHA
jgi:hypothetical protein